MLARRGFLRAMFAAPVAAPMVAKAAMAEGPVISPPMPMPRVSREDAFRSAFGQVDSKRYRRVRMMRDYERDALHLSSRYSERKSWASHFKVRCHIDDLLDSKDRHPNYWEMSFDDLLKKATEDGVLDDVMKTASKIMEESKSRYSEESEVGF